MGGVLGTSHQKQLQEDYNVVKLLSDGTAFLKHRKTKDQFFLRYIASNSEEQMQGFQEMLQTRKSIKSPHLLELVQVNKKQEKHVCSQVHKLYMLVEYPFQTLRQEIDDKKKQSEGRFTQSEIWSILYSCSKALDTLYSNKIAHQCLTTNMIFINKQGLIKTCDPLLVGGEKNYIAIMKGQQQQPQLNIQKNQGKQGEKNLKQIMTDMNPYISPQIMNFLDDCNFSYYDKEKSDVFTLGAILLETVLLQKLQIYDAKKKTAFLGKLPQMIKEMEKRGYSMSLIRMVEKMLGSHGKNRPTFANIVQEIENDSSGMGIVGNTSENVKNLSSAPPPQVFPVGDKKQQPYISSFSYSSPIEDGVRSTWNMGAIRNISIDQKMLNNELGPAYTNKTIVDRLNSKTMMNQQPLSWTDNYRQQQIYKPFDKSKPGNNEINGNSAWLTRSYQQNKIMFNYQPPTQSIPIGDVIRQKNQNIPNSHYHNYYCKNIPYQANAIKSVYTHNNQPKQDHLTNSHLGPNHTINKPNLSPNRQSSYYQSQISASSHKYSGSPGKKGNLQENPLQPKYVCLLLADGEKYEGYMLNGMKNGKGKLSFRDGGFYQGQWKDNTMCGYGKLHYQNGALAYQGNWQDDEFHGLGKVYNDNPQSMMNPHTNRPQTFNCGDFAQLGEKWAFYEGEFKRDCKHGRGKIHLSNGQIFDGNFIMDSIEGEGVFHTLRGELVRGIWRDNMMV